MTNSSSVLKWQHSSMQYSDTGAQQRADVHDLFHDPSSLDFHIKSGTEAGPDAGPSQNRSALIEVCKEANHRIVFWRDNWVAVDRAIIKPGTWHGGGVFVADNDETVGPGHDSGFVTASFEHVDEGIGVINIASCHYPTHGRTPKDPNYDINKRYADYLGRWGKVAGKGSALAFVSGDFNMPFGRGGKPVSQDVFFGNPFTSAWNETKTFENTGHGNIDGIASYDHDGRVKAKWIKALDDSEFPQFSDHFVVRAAFTVRHLAKHPVA